MCFLPPAIRMMAERLLQARKCVYVTSEVPSPSRQEGQSVSHFQQLAVAGIILSAELALVPKASLVSNGPVYQHLGLHLTLRSGR
jgi:hypothetical protein